MAPHSKTPRLHLNLALTAGEIRELGARAAAELRQPGPFVTRIVAEHLRLRGRVNIAPIAPGQRRRFDVQLALTARERRELAAQAKADGRSVAGYVSLILARALEEGE
jgi:phage replication-related protein YjqB (UPF0714/DUF867 family)